MVCEAKVWDLFSKVATSNLKKVKDIPWNLLIDLRNRAAHLKEGVSLKQDEAQLMYIYTKLFLIECEIVSEYFVTENIDNRPCVFSCLDCNQKVEIAWKFCPFCGTGINLNCPECKRVIKGRWRRCRWCDAELFKSGEREDLFNKHEYKIICRGAWLDGVVNRRERDLLEEKRCELNLTCEEAEEIETECAPAKNLSYMNIVEAVLSDNEITQQERLFLNKIAVKLEIDSWLKQQIEDALMPDKN